MQNITETGLSTISNKIVETALSNRVKKKYPPPPPPPPTSIQSWVFVNF